MNTVNFVTIPSSIVPDQEILVFGERRLTYAQLGDRIARLCAAFKQLDLKPRDVIAVLDTNSDLYIQFYYAAAKAGLTFLPLNYRAKDAELEYMLNTAKAKVLLAGDRYLEIVGRIRPRLTVSTIAAIGAGAPGMPRIEDLIAKARPDESEAEVDDEDTSILMYTSGTTSLPKGVMLSFRDFTAYVTANVEMADGADRGVALVCVPFYHIAGTTAYMTKPLDRPQSDSDAAVRRRGLARPGPARARNECFHRADDDEATHQRYRVRWRRPVVAEPILRMAARRCRCK